jgi:hypothetical protein
MYTGHKVKDIPGKREVIFVNVSNITVQLTRMNVNVNVFLCLKRTLHRDTRNK